MRSSDFLYLLADVDDDLILSTQEVPDMKNMKKNPSRTLRIVLIAAAVFVMLAGTVLAATYNLWSPGLASQFGADEAAQEALLESGMASLTGDPSVTMENGLTMTVEQTLCNGVETIVVVRYDVPEENWLSRENRKWATIYTLSSLEIGNMSYPASGSGFDQNTLSDTMAYMILRFQGDGSTQSGEKATLHLQPPTNVEQSDDNAISQENPLLLSDAVDISWTWDSTSSLSKSLEGIFSGEYTGKTMTIEDVILTPISIQFTMTEGLNMVGNPAENPEALYPTGIVLTDETTIGWNGGHLGEADAVPVDYEPETLSGYFTFDTTVLDLDSIAGITFAAWADTPIDPEVGDVIVFTLPLQ